MITIDGSEGEGGGQVLRTALGLSLVTGRPFQINNIRGKRKKPGLMRQHLTAVRAAAEIGNAHTEGAKIGSDKLSFAPDSIHHGKCHFAIGTAGSCTLVFQAILPALLMASGPSEIILEGGTHNPMAPPFDFLEHTFLPLINRMGANVKAEMERPGFFPAGGGRIIITVEPAKSLLPLELTEVSNINFTARAVSAELPGHIAQRELKVVKAKLDITDNDIEQIQLDKFGPGNVLSIFANSDQLTETFTGFGQKNVSAEKVAVRAVGLARDYFRIRAPVGRYLADQLLIPISLAGKGRFRTSKPSNHTLTNIQIIKLFLELGITISEIENEVWEVNI